MMLHQYPIINDDPSTQHLADPPAGAARGAVPRDYAEQPADTFAAPPSQMTLIPRSEWDARIDEQDALQSSLEHIYLAGGQPAFVNLDQNGHGYCWAYSTGHAIMLDRLRSNLPLVRLNPHATAAIIKGGRDEGGWCGLSAKFAREHGYAEQGNGAGQWPLHSRSLSNDTPQLRAEMAKRKVVEDWTDLTRDVYDQNLTFDQLATQLLCNNPGPVDFNWWSHSVCAVRLVRIERGSYGILILNSWLGWGRFGLGVLQGSRCIPDGALTVRATTPSM